MPAFRHWCGERDGGGGVCVKEGVGRGSGWVGRVGRGGGTRRKGMLCVGVWVCREKEVSVVCVMCVWCVCVLCVCVYVCE